jgi:ABC-2 type transport system ATP-binding protein
MAPALVIEGLEKRFGTTEAVRGLGLMVEPGEIFGLIGPDGAGKTTTMRAVTGLIHKDAGRIEALGFQVPGDERKLRAHLGYMPQQYSLYGDLSVQENLRFFAGMYGVARGDLLSREKRLLDIARLEQFRDRIASALSGGMYKKLALACALVHAPRLLLLDEPTNGVDPISRRELWAFLRELLGEGVAVLVSTPYMDEAERCTRVGLMVDGRLVAQGAPGALVAGFRNTIFELAAQPAPPTVAQFAGRPGALDVYAIGKRLHVVSDDAAYGEVLARAGAELGIAGLRVARVPPTFEDVFMSLSAGQERPS